MFKVKSPKEAYEIITNAFSSIKTGTENVRAEDALGSIIAEDVYAAEDVPAFDRSMVDGYAVYASDTYGASESLPAMINLAGEVLMGEAPSFSLNMGECAYVPTGGELPKGSDAAVMIEDTEMFGDSIVCVGKPCAPGANMIHRGEDAVKGQLIIKKGTKIRPQEIGTLHALGITEIEVRRPLRVGIISTGDELIPPEQTPVGAQIRNVNTGLLCAGVKLGGNIAVDYGTIKDKYDLLRDALKKAVSECDVVLVSGGSSVGLRDATANVIEELGELLLHGIAVKPGKPTIVGKAGNTAVFGLPGHPVAAYFIFSMFVAPLMTMLKGEIEKPKPIVLARLSKNISSNHGREEYVAVALKKGENGYYAEPSPGKSGLITTLTHADGYVRVDRDSEGIAKDSEVEVYVF